MIELCINNKYSDTCSLLCNMEPAGHDFIEYSIKLPDGIGYYNVNSISFVIEIDNKDGATVYDIEQINISCDMFSKCLVVKE